MTSTATPSEAPKEVVPPAPEAVDPAALRDPRSTHWRVEAADRLRWLDCEKMGLASIVCIDKALSQARAVLVYKGGKRTPRQRIAAWWSGWDLERTWRALHDAEARVVANTSTLAGRLPMLVAWTGKYLPSDSAGQKALVTLNSNVEQNPTMTLGAGERAVVESTLRAAFEVEDDAHSALRALRNKLFIASVVLLALMLTLGLVVWAHPQMLPLCPTKDPAIYCPTGGSSATSGDIWFVFLLGSLGAAIAAVLALTKLRPSMAPYTLSGYLAGVKVLLGPIFAVLGLLALQVPTIDGLLPVDNRAAVLLGAVIFGYSQQATTRLLDGYAKQVMKVARPVAAEK